MEPIAAAIVAGTVVFMLMWPIIVHLHYKNRK